MNLGTTYQQKTFQREQIADNFVVWLQLTELVCFYLSEGLLEAASQRVLPPMMMQKSHTFNEIVSFPHLRIRHFPH
jgi:hypothetical protein